MNKSVFTYLQSYSTSPTEVDRLIVSAFLYSTNTIELKNELLKSYLIKEQDEDYSKLMEFLQLQNFSNFEELIEVFEFVVSPEDKIVNGAVYTPKHIREYIVDQALLEVEDLENCKLCDPACGCAGFLFSAAQKIKNVTGQSYQYIFTNNLFGVDIQEFSITRSKLLLTLLAISEGEDLEAFSYNLFQGNTLNFDWNKTMEIFEGFDLIVGNPPYVCSRNIDEESKKYLANWSVSTSGHPDLYIPFFQIAVENLKPNGVLGYITVNTFFKSINGRALRKFFKDEKLALRIFDFGSNQVFQSKSTYTCICLIKKTESSIIEYAKGNENALQSNIDFKTVNYSCLNSVTGWNLQDSELLNKIESVGAPFGKLYHTRNGIATLKNSIYIFSPIREDDEYYYLQNGDVFPVEKGLCKEIINPNKLSRVDDIEGLREKAIFPYKYNERGDAFLLSEEELKESYPLAFAYLSNKKSILATRDKGKGKYENWFAYGRRQSFERYEHKLFFPHITPQIPNYVINNEKDLLFYNGIAVVSDDELELRFLKKLLSTDLFWYYIQNSSKPYGSGYYSLSRNYIKNFGVYDFSDKEKELIASSDMEIVNDIVENCYGVKLTI